MKITEDSINHNALRLINDVLQNPYDMLDGAEDAEFSLNETRIMTLGEIHGIIELATELKKVLRE